ncbi:WG containing repeat-containing protein [Chitinophaga eiseniae]|uniref:WG containing repeat-containing protein n=1 Tax=Chitinophaga eiseniae TaxID=634771 RepID=A0A1T4NH54_9BACT|nr:WG repeat-containing protein [Chitinophaga eiseniae]SJZ78453.1 WG containing repeat-containing protein [Chitinophaga eiseniae]
MNKKIIFFIALLLAGHTLPAQQGSVFTNGLARIVTKEKSWFIDTTGQKVFDKIVAVYHPVDSIVEGSIYSNTEKNMLIVSSNGKKGLVNEKGQWVLKPEYDTLEVRFNTYLAVYRQGKMTYADTWGKLLVPLQFEQVGILDDDRYDVKQQGKWGIYDVRRQQLVIPAVYDEFDYCGGCGRKSDYLYAKKNGRWGIISAANEELVPFAFDHSHSRMRSDEWVCSFRQNGKDVVVNIPRKKVYGEPLYSQMEVIGDGMLKLQKDGHFGLINRQGEQVLDFVYDDISDPYGQFASGPFLTIRKEGKTGIVDMNGRMVIPPSLDEEIICSDDYIVAARNGMYNVFDSAGKPLLKEDYSEIEPLKITGGAPLFALKQKALYGFFNPVNGKIVAPAFHEIDVISSGKSKGMVQVTYQGKSGLYRPDGSQLLPLKYSSYELLNDHVLMVTTGAGTGLFDANTREEIIPAKFKYMSRLSQDSTLLSVTSENESGDPVYGLYHISGKELAPPVYTYISALNQEHYLLTKEKTHAVLSLSTGKIAALPYTDVVPAHAANLLVVSDGRQSWLWNVVENKTVSPPFPMVRKYEDDTVLTSPIGTFAFGVALLEKNGKMGVINTSGKEVVPVIYDGASLLKQGVVLLARKNGDAWKYGYVDTTGKLLVPLEYDYNVNGYIYDYEDSTYLPLYKSEGGYSRAYKKGIAGRDGKVLVPAIYDRVFVGIGGTGFLADKDRQFTILNAAGKEVTSAKFSAVMLDPSVNPQADAAVLSYPLLCRQGERYVYLLSNGKTLPLQLTAVIRFEEFDNTIGYHP